MRRNITAFTLIELLVVIAILSLLVSILLPSLTAAKELAKSSACLANTRSLLFAQQLYAEDYHVYAAYYKTGSPVIAFLECDGYLPKVWYDPIYLSPGETINFSPYVCANVPAAVKTSSKGTKEWESNMLPYGWNCELGVWYSGNHANPVRPYTSPEQVEKPTDCIGWADAMQRSDSGIVSPRMWDYYWFWRPPSPRHGKGTSVPVIEPVGPLGTETLSAYPEGSYTNGTFLDGHGEPVSLERMKDNLMYLPHGW